MFDLALSTLLLALVSGALVGAVLHLVGGGGSILALPLLVYLVGYQGDPHVAIGTTALAVAVSAFVNTLHHVRGGNVRLGAGVWFAIPGVAGALLGAQVGLRTDAERLLFLFAFLMLFVAWRMWRSASRVPGPMRRTTAGPDRRAVALAGLGVGALSGLFGIGGGFLIVPALVWVAKLGMREAVGTSLVAVTAFGLTTAGGYALAGQLDLALAAVFIAGGLAGGFAGARVGGHLEERRLRRTFALMLLPVAAYMLYRNAAHILGSP